MRFYGFILCAMCAVSPLCFADGFDYHTSTLTNKTGRNATDVTVTYDRVVFGGKSLTFTNPPHLDPATPMSVTFDGGALGNNKPDTIVTAFDPRDKAKNTSVLSASWSFADNPKSVAIPMPKVEVKDTKFQGGSLDGAFDLFNEDTVPIYIANLKFAKDVPASLFGTTPDELNALATNMLFIGSGTPVGAPSGFALNPGDVMRLNAGAVTESGFLAIEFDAGFAPGEVDVTIGHASADVPEPIEVGLIGVGLLGVGIFKRLGRSLLTNHT